MVSYGAHAPKLLVQPQPLQKAVLQKIFGRIAELDKGGGL